MMRVWKKLSWKAILIWQESVWRKLKSLWTGRITFYESQGMERQHIFWVLTWVLTKKWMLQGWSSCDPGSLINGQHALRINQKLHLKGLKLPTFTAIFIRLFSEWVNFMRGIFVSHCPILNKYWKLLHFRNSDLLISKALQALRRYRWQVHME